MVKKKENLVFFNLTRPEIFEIFFLSICRLRSTHKTIVAVDRTGCASCQGKRKSSPPHTKTLS